MSTGFAGVQLAGWKSQIFEAVLGFLPDWVQITAYALLALAVLVYWGLKIKNKIAQRRAARSGQPVTAPARPGQGRGADYLGAYAPQHVQPAPAPERSGADFLGAYAPQRHPQDG
ncbi:hypothetical protein HCJ93_02600 [Streptomyces sp. SBST2-5]|uniref:Integral membrane protein n=1 Tax=Streptomyces composti TaxID=2720025 RepID=A0ABX1A1D5_9ACTN|nr:hypothetical protein [Streptomyces composti]NJP48990.1 hypothetical protein [Streptomyces composti]